MLTKPLAGRADIRRVCEIIGLGGLLAGGCLGLLIAAPPGARPGWILCAGVIIGVSLCIATAYRRLTAAERHNEAIYRRDDERAKRRRPPTPAEAVALGVLAHAAQALSPWLHRFWAERPVHYTVAPSEFTLGLYFNGWGRDYREEHICFAEKVFTGGFAVALATYLHEHAHAFGSDGSRRFTDGLTELIESVVTHRRHVDAIEARWEEARAQVLGERIANLTGGDG